MSTNALRAAATGQAMTAPGAEKPKTIAGLLSDPKIKAQMALALPAHVSAERLARIALTEVRKVPKLAECDQTSFLGAIMQCCALGLEPGGALGHCYLIPFENRRQNRMEVQFIVGYRGMIDLARRSGQIVSLSARTVHANDLFRFSYGLDETLEHEPADGDRGEMIAVYAVAKLQGGGVQFEVMRRAEIEKVRNESQGYKTAVRYDRKDSPWIAHFDEMAKKTVVRRLFKYLPVSIELQRAVGLDEQAEMGMRQDNPLTVDADYSEARTLTHDDSDPATGDATPTGAANVIAAMSAAITMDALNDAYDLLREMTPTQAEREEATRVYDARSAELSA